MQFHQCIMSFTVLSGNALYKDETARLEKKKDEKQKLFLLQTCLLLGFNYPNLFSKLFFEVLPQTGKLQKKKII